MQEFVPIRNRYNAPGRARRRRLLVASFVALLCAGVVTSLTTAPAAGAANSPAGPGKVSDPSKLAQLRDQKAGAEAA